MATTPARSNGAQPSQTLNWEQIPLTVNGTAISVSTVRRDGTAEPILFLHGFGSTKEDYTDISLHPSLSKYPIIAYDAPGSGSSTIADYSALSMPFLVAVAEAVLKTYGVKKYHLVGHSMGGLTALLLAQRDPGSVLSFTNIKGNLAPEDCFLSRQILDFPADDPEMFVTEFIERTRQSAFFGNGVYAAAFRAKVRPEAIRPTFESMVEYSDNGDLLEIFKGLACPRMFMFGVQHATLSYLPAIAKAGVELAEIPKSGHFVMYTNPVAMWDRIEDFLGRASDVTTKVHIRSTT
ncbi:Dihydrolipoyllysine-residue acetyltransferase component of acetoin cleaving system [Colletotrichum siamense]|nr:Dihydrolipoyllysine-residue acetyltransferase component of acetoin cleaving system [Colletotrichum siamense]